MIAPKLLREQFDASGEAGLDFSFAGKALSVRFSGGTGKDCGAYRVGSARLTCADGRSAALPVADGQVLIRRGELLALPDTGNTIFVELM